MTDVRLTDEVRDVLTRSTITDNLLILPQQLPRKLYESVNKVLVNCGGKWNRFKKGHVFPADPRIKLGLSLETGVAIDEQKKWQAFFTPDDIADRMVDLAEIGPRMIVLEPSAGYGSLIRALWRYDEDIPVIAVEKNPEFCEVLQKLPVPVHETNFLTWMPSPSRRFDRILMNPPFHNGEDIRHILHARQFLQPGGMIVAICAAGPKQREQLKPLAETWEELPAGTFKESGTDVRSILLTIRDPDAPAEIQEPEQEEEPTPYYHLLTRSEAGTLSPQQAHGMIGHWWTGREGTKRLETNDGREQLHRVYLRKTFDHNPEAIPTCVLESHALDPVAVDAKCWFSRQLFTRTNQPVTLPEEEEKGSPMAVSTNHTVPVVVRSTDDDLRAQIEQLMAENDALKTRQGKGIYMKVSEKGGVSVYGLGRFPVTLYKEQWERLLAMADDIRAFIAAHESELKTKAPKH